MRILFYLLLLANLSLFGYTELDKMSSGEGVRLRQQLQPEKVRVLTREQVTALGADRTAAATEAR